MCFIWIGTRLTVRIEADTLANGIPSTTLILTDVTGPTPRPKHRGPKPMTLALRYRNDKFHREWKDGYEDEVETATPWIDLEPDHVLPYTIK